MYPFLPVGCEGTFTLCKHHEMYIFWETDFQKKVYLWLLMLGPTVLTNAEVQHILLRCFLKIPLAINYQITCTLYIDCLYHCCSESECVHTVIYIFYIHVTMHRDKFLCNKTK